MAMLESAIDDSQPGYIREAAAQSLLTSRVHSRLVPPIPGAATLRCRLWLLVLSILQDEDDDVRAFGGAYVEKNINTSSSCASLPVADGLARERIVAALVKDLVQDVRDGNPGEGHKRVLAVRDSFLVPFASIRALLDSEQSKIGNEKVFEEEQANLYAEKLVVLNSLNEALVTANLELSGQSKNSKTFECWVLELLMDQAREATDIIAVCSEMDGTGTTSQRLSGGLTFHREVYLTCSSALRVGRIILAQSEVHSIPTEALKTKMETLLETKNIHPLIKDIVAM